MPPRKAKVKNQDSGLPKGYLSATSISMYLKCPRQFEFRYVAGIKSPPGLSLVEGSSYHDAIAKNNRRLMVGKKGYNVDGLVGLFEETFAEEGRNISDWEGEDFDSVMRRSEFVLARHVIACASPDGKPKEITAVEAQIEFDIEGVPILGFIDLEGKLGKDRSVTIYDYKFSNRAVPESVLRHNLQLTMYAIHGKKSNVGIIRNERKQTGKHEITRAKVDATAKQMAKQTVVGVACGVKAGAFPATSADNWWCNPKWCGYWNQCRGSRKFNAKIVDMGSSND